MNETMCARDIIQDESEYEESSSPRPDPLSVYLREAAKYPMLSREEEREITRLVYEEQDLDAAEKLAVSNLRLVVKIALGYYGTYLNILDLIQEGNEGLLHAVKKYNPYKGTKFSTYAQFWIRAYILKYIMDSWSLVKVGTTQGQRRLFYRLNKERRRLETLGLYPAPKLLASTLGVKETDVVDMEMRLSLTDVSLDAPITDRGDDTGMDLLSSDEDVEEIVSEKEKSVLLAEKVKAFRATLNEKEICIFDNRVMAETRLSLQQIGTRFQISRERVRQIEQRVIKKARENLNGSIMQLDLWPIYKTSRVSGASLAIQVT
ncbi:MAG: RNA polymerase sigma factor RpoH [Syntrophorhabdus sp. PtaU1.Bin050]|nr:MAG: RNA polymerase sigma factor RpoH [Syntrophorhabdus sp. PtaU1.Bin050]